MHRAPRSGATLHPTKAMVSRYEPFVVTAANVEWFSGLNTIIASSTRYSHSCPGVRGQLNLQMEAVPVCSDSILVGFEVPAHADFTVSADVL